MQIVATAVLTALLAAAATAGGLLLLWRRVLVPDLEGRARVLADEAVARASADLTTAGEALVPQIRTAVRDGIRDALLTPPTDRIGQTARGAASVGLDVVEASLRRILGAPGPRPPEA